MAGASFLSVTSGAAVRHRTMVQRYRRVYPGGVQGGVYTGMYTGSGSGVESGRLER